MTSKVENWRGHNCTLCVAEKEQAELAGRDLGTRVNFARGTCAAVWRWTRRGQRMREVCGNFVCVEHGEERDGEWVCRSCVDAAHQQLMKPPASDAQRVTVPLRQESLFAA